MMTSTNTQFNVGYYASTLRSIGVNTVLINFNLYMITFPWWM